MFPIQVEIWLLLTDNLTTSASDHDVAGTNLVFKPVTQQQEQLIILLETWH